MKDIFIIINKKFNTLKIEILQNDVYKISIFKKEVERYIYMKIKLDAHPSVLIAYSPETQKFLFSVYDEGYPRKSYRNSANLIGGNPESEDKCPEDTLIKEIAGEINPNHTLEKLFIGKVEWADESEIRFIRNSLFQFYPLQDFLAKQPEVMEGGNKPYQAIYSVFYSEIPKKTIEIVERNMVNKKEISCEGNLGVFGLEQLTNSSRREFSTAHITAHVLNWKYNSQIPQTKQISAEAIGLPKNNYKEYLKDFDYNQERLVLATLAKN